MDVKVIRSNIEEGRLVLVLRIELEMSEIKEELSETEKYVLNMVIANGEVTQKQIAQTLGAVKACRVIHNLEKKGLIRRERKGKTYIIRI